MMAGKGQIEPRVTKNKKYHHRLRKRKLDLKKEKEKVKLFSGMLAEVGAVQAELMEDMDSPQHLTQCELRLKCDQLRGVNVQGALLNAMVQSYVEGMLAVLLADEAKGN